MPRLNTPLWEWTPLGFLAWVFVIVITVVLCILVTAIADEMIARRRARVQIELAMKKHGALLATIEQIAATAKKTKEEEKVDA
jgi:ABC-type bacteriocin/lantibiotic exporter with double-glycine peptidase domain